MKYEVRKPIWLVNIYPIRNLYRHLFE